MHSHSTIPATSGIYRITCAVTRKIYIGSAMNLRKRWKDHSFYLQRNEHHNPKLQAAWNKYGPDAFTFEVWELVLPISLTARSEEHTSELQSHSDLVCRLLLEKKKQNNK